MVERSDDRTVANKAVGEIQWDSLVTELPRVVWCRDLVCVSMMCDSCAHADGDCRRAESDV